MLKSIDFEHSYSVVNAFSLSVLDLSFLELGTWNLELTTLTHKPDRLDLSSIFFFPGIM